VATILYNNGILPLNYKENSPAALELKENHLLNKKNLIKFVKICANCFYIYNFLHEKLAAKEYNLLRTSSDWLHREKRFSQTFNESLKISLSKHQKKDLSHEFELKTSRENEEEYSFLKKQTIGSHVLNLGFSSSFRTTFKLEENSPENHNIPIVQRQNLFEMFGNNYDEPEKNSALKKKAGGVELTREYSRKSSVTTLLWFGFQGDFIE